MFQAVFFCLAHCWIIGRFSTDFSTTEKYQPNNIPKNVFEEVFFLVPGSFFSCFRRLFFLFQEVSFLVSAGLFSGFR